LSSQRKYWTHLDVSNFICTTVKMPAAAIAAAGGNRKSGAFPRPANVPLLPAAPSTPRSNSVSAASGPSTPRRGSGVAPPASPRSNVSGDSGANGIAEARPVLLMDRPISHVRAKRDPKIFNPEDKSNGKRIYLVSSSPSPPSKKKGTMLRLILFIWFSQIVEKK
jgi:hypothetical protein